MSRKRRITADEKNVAAGGKKTFGPIFKIVIAAAAIVVGSLVPIVAGQGVFARAERTDQLVWSPPSLSESLLMREGLPQAKAAVDPKTPLAPAEAAVRLRICGIAGPGIPIGTLMQYTVSGTGALSAAPPESAVYGPVSKTVEVDAGDPAAGGHCVFVPGVGAPAPGYDQFQTFVTGTAVTVIQNGISPSNGVPQLPGELRASRVRADGSIFASTAAAGFSPNPDITPGSGYVSRAVVIAGPATTGLEFANFRFNPTVLKVCKIAGTSGLLGSDFTFDVALVSPTSLNLQDGTQVSMFPAFSIPVTVAAGSAAQGGNCGFVNGNGALGGAFNQGSTITITERASTGSVTAITCVSCSGGGLTADLPNRRATLSGSGGLTAGISAVTFTNSVTIISDPRPGPFDFDGDFKADPAVVSPATSTWTIAASGSGYPHRTSTFGASGDKLVPGDYDGDGKGDVAVWRPSTGQWFFLGTTGIYEYHNWGQEGDIPLTGDFNGDGKADFVVWRPSNSTVYIKTSSGTLRVFQFGIPSDKPMAADFDGDGLTDIGMFRNGTWYTLSSQIGFRVTQFGVAGDIPVPRDYDGDGAADIAVYRAGVWFILTRTEYSVRVYGTGSDIPVPADYDADGKADLAYYRPSEGKWYIWRSATSTELEVVLGGPEDIPLESL